MNKYKQFTHTYVSVQGFMILVALEGKQSG